MNSFYKVVEFLKSHFENDNFVHTITHGVINDIDIDKKNIFPLTHFSVTGSQVVEGMIVFNFTIWVLDIRNISKKPLTDKFLKNDNELDNLNTCFAIANRFLTKLRLQQNDDDIELFANSNPTPIQYDFSNILDGWEFEVQLSIPNNNIEICS
jgi:hypothetical protein